MTIGQRIREARGKCGMKQVELGEKVGVSGVAIMRYEKGTREPRLEQLQRIAAALGVSVSDLLDKEKGDNTMSGKISLQEQFLDHLKDKQQPVAVITINGFQLKGRIIGHDRYSIQMDVDGRQLLVYKHAVSTIKEE